MDHSHTAGLHGDAEEPPIHDRDLFWTDEITLGRGSFGEVYWGRYQGREVAVKKLMYTDEFKEQLSAFTELQTALDCGRRSISLKRNSQQYSPVMEYLRELRSYRRFAHENIIRYEGTTKGSYGEQPLVVIEYARGGSLSQALGRIHGAQLSEPTFLRVLKHIARGLAYLHSQGYIHGDLKPENVLLSEPFTVNQNIASLARGARAMLTDFGYSRRFMHLGLKNMASATVQANERVKGTRSYLAPEAFGDTIDFKDLFAVDVYAFGTIIYELATGKPAWNREHVIDLESAVRSGRRPDWGFTKVPTHYKDLVEACWQTDPSNRPDCNTILERLNDIKPPPPPSEKVMWPKRRPVDEKYWDCDALRRPAGVKMALAAYYPGDSINDLRSHLLPSVDPTKPLLTDSSGGEKSGDQTTVLGEQELDDIAKQASRALGDFGGLSGVGLDQAAVVFHALEPTTESDAESVEAQGSGV